MWFCETCYPKRDLCDYVCFRDYIRSDWNNKFGAFALLLLPDFQFGNGHFRYPHINCSERAGSENRENSMQVSSEALVDVQMAAQPRLGLIVSATLTLTEDERFISLNKFRLRHFSLRQIFNELSSTCAQKRV